MDSKNDVYVFLESPGIKSEETNRNLLSEGSRIAGLLGGSLYVIEEEDSECSHEAIASAATEVLKSRPFRILLLAHTDRGRILAPLIAFNFRTMAVLDCRDIRLGDGILSYAKWAHDGQFEQEIRFKYAPEIVTLSRESCEMTGQTAASPPAVNWIRLQTPPHSDRKKATEIIPPDFRTMDIRYAERILDIGSGCDQPHLLHLCERLARLLEASIATTRPVVDNRQIDKKRMLGQTGKTASPELLLALGVSGSPHHIAGIQQSGIILSVNSDIRAPILQISNTGFVSDLNAVLPKLVRRLEQYRDEGLS